MERPDLSNVDAAIVTYIESLEAKLLASSASKPSRGNDAPLEPSEPPTTINIITISEQGVAKRTPRHLYSRQRRAGMGVFDIDTPEEDPPRFLLAADETAHLLIFTNQGRAYRSPVAEIQQTEGRGRGSRWSALAKIRPEETVAAILPEKGGMQVALASERGWVRTVDRAHLGASLIDGIRFHDPSQGGPLAAACWAAQDGDLFLATRHGNGLRFSVRQVPGRTGKLGVRIADGDKLIGVSHVTEDGAVFLVGHDGKGTVRQMSGFRANKTPGGGAKAVMKTEQLIHVQSVADEDDVFIISHLGKVIRFAVADIPPKAGVVQGVNCMSLRADSVKASILSGKPLTDS